MSRTELNPITEKLAADETVRKLRAEVDALESAYRQAMRQYLEAKNRLNDAVLAASGLAGKVIEYTSHSLYAAPKTHRMRVERVTDAGHYFVGPAIKKDGTDARRSSQISIDKEFIVVE